MKLIVMGTGPFAVPTAEQLCASGHEILLVVTRPVAGKSKKPPPRPVYDWAVERGLPIYEPDSINDEAAIEHLRSLTADLFFVCDYGQILSDECLGAARLGGINLHGSILPRHRGAAPVQWAILAGDRQAGVTVIHMTPRLDAGPALVTSALDVEPLETAEELEPRLSQLGVQATIESVEMLEEWNGSDAIGAVQDRSLVTRAPRFAKSDGQLDFRLNASYLSRLVRACQPWPATFGHIVWPGGKSIRVIVRLATDVENPADSQSEAGAEIGTCREVDPSFHPHVSQWKKAICVQCGSGSLLIGRIQPAGKRAMDVEEFLRGHPLTEGCRFELPEEPVEALCD